MVMTPTPPLRGTPEDLSVSNESHLYSNNHEGGSKTAQYGIHGSYVILPVAASTYIMQLFTYTPCKEQLTDWRIVK
ncbi:hypothetical protein E2C01_000730 [Portunus trituberculatus]|uniref:Uncharacterized protein n=1 Tax=Portunus trituberculatus TaxID=210409 RepID=A0A5B7CKQ8_PORTR|nr:hypothetical protein [Portunus trituberculatus]